jgi:selenocysteine-specific elongation factor
MAVIVTAGHVDHGKSSLIQALTGIHPDRLAEEKRRGMTIDLGFAHTGDLSFVDVPGHSDFVNTMVAGVNGVRCALLVIDAGEGWKPQTVEHLDILMLMHVQHIVVAITKCDTAEELIIQALVTSTQNEFAIRDYLAHDIICTSTLTGQGIEELRDSLSSLVTQSLTSIVTSHEPRLFIDRVFTMAGSGTVVTGTLTGAPVHIGDELVVSLTQQHTKIRSIQQHGTSAEIAFPGMRCALNLTAVTVTDLHRGDVLVREKAWHTTEVFDAQLESAFSVRRAHNTTPLKNGGGYTLHIGSARRAASIRFLGTDTSRMRLRFDGALPLVPGDRFLLRRTGDDTTVGGGTILDVKPVIPTTRATPDGTPASILEHHGWLSTHDAQLLVGAPVEAVVGDWVASPGLATTTQNILMQKLDTAPLDTTQLMPWERAIVNTFSDITVTQGIAVRSQADPLLSHPYVLMFSDAGVVTPDTQALDRDVIRRLTHAGVLFEHDNIAFHSDTLVQLRPTLAELWQHHPTGFGIAHLREALGITRKHAVPLATCLDKYGFTKRAGDVRVPGIKW